MSRNLWGTVYHLKPAEASPGTGISQDYFGFHVESNRTAAADAQTFHTTEAETLAELTERRRLNEGNEFSGHLANCRVGHVRLIVVNHTLHGICAYVDEMTSHANNLIEIISGDAKSRRISTRNDFFGNLSDDELSEEDIESVCRAFYRVRILLNRN